MSHLPPLARDAIPEFKERFDHYQNTRGFIPNSILTMSRRPAIAKAFMQLNQAVLYEGTANVAQRTIAAVGWQAGKHG